MKKILLVCIFVSVCSLICAETSAEFNEDMGFDLSSHSKISGVRTSRDIPDDGLLLIPDSGSDRR